MGRERVPCGACSFSACFSPRDSSEKTPTPTLCGLYETRGADRETTPSSWPSASAGSRDSLMENIHPFWASSLFHHFNKLRTDWKAGNIVSRAPAPTFQLNYRICFSGLARGSWDAAERGRERVWTKRPEKAIQSPAQSLTKDLRPIHSPLWGSSSVSGMWGITMIHPSSLTGWRQHGK